MVSFGAFFLFLGILLFFDGPLLALGNVLFTAGITLLIGPQKTFYFFARKQKIRGTICFFTGMLLVFAKWTIIGMIVEAVGFLNLFGYVFIFGTWQSLHNASVTFSPSFSISYDNYLSSDKY